MAHNPNPFDFVPFPPQPMIYERSYLDRRGAPVSGYIDVEIKALTPVHVIGTVERQGDASYSSMYKQDNEYVIPAASIRGMLRSFIEALTGGWVSQAKETYPKEYRERHLGFSLFESYTDDRERSTPPAIKPAFKPMNRDDGKIDIATYLFGIVTEPEKEDDQPLMLRSKVWVEDAIIPPEAIVADEYWTPDIDGEAFMGGPKPNRSNWWYFYPKKVQKRIVRFANGNTSERAEFVGQKLRGRKFYFHQNPKETMDFYHPRQRNWNYPDGFSPIWLESMRPGATTKKFRIYVDKVPTILFILLELALTPGNIRHKLGYGKAYGYGSVELKLGKWHLRVDKPGSIPGGLEEFSYNFNNWNDGRLDQMHVRDFIDSEALQWLARIGNWEPTSRITFTYPPFSGGNFSESVSWQQFTQRVEQIARISDNMPVTPILARKIAKALFPLKKPIHFRYYQEQANGWDIIEKRTP